MSERLLCYAKWTVVSFVIDQLIWIYILQWWLKQQCACTCNHVAPLPVSVPTRFCIHYSKILYVLSGEAANTNFSHWLHPDAERTRGLLHSSRALSTTSLGWSYTLIDINALCIQCRRRVWIYQRGKQVFELILISRFQMPSQHEACRFYIPKHNYNSSLFDTI